jgi:hypothetical protein
MQNISFPFQMVLPVRYIPAAGRISTSAVACGCQRAPQTRTCAHNRARRSYAPGNQAIGRWRSISRILGCGTCACCARCHRNKNRKARAPAQEHPAKPACRVVAHSHLMQMPPTPRFRAIGGSVDRAALRRARNGTGHLRLPFAQDTDARRARFGRRGAWVVQTGRAGWMGRTCDVR